MRYHQLPSQEKLQELLIHDDETGRFIRRTSAGGFDVGTMVGFTEENGYRRTQVEGIRYLEHRLVWMYYTGKDPGCLDIDHRNRIRDDNRISNLRLATVPENNNNNPTHKGYTYVKTAKRPWKSHKRIDGDLLHLGYHSTEEAARAMYVFITKKWYGEFAPAC